MGIFHTASNTDLRTDLQYSRSIHAHLSRMAGALSPYYFERDPALQFFQLPLPSCTPTPTLLYFRENHPSLQEEEPSMSAPQPPTPVAVFCAFAQPDLPSCLQLEDALKLAQRQKVLTLWHEGHIPVGM